MNVLLDIHTLLWSLNGKQKLSNKVKNLLADITVNKVVSAVSFWETAIKVSTGRLEIDFPLLQLPSLVAKSGCSVFTIRADHTLAVASLPFHHKGPFDRLLIAQAQIENLTIITKDANVLLYNVATFW